MKTLIDLELAAPYKQTTPGHNFDLLNCLLKFSQLQLSRFAYGLSRISQKIFKKNICHWFMPLNRFFCCHDLCADDCVAMQTPDPAAGSVLHLTLCRYSLRIGPPASGASRYRRKIEPLGPAPRSGGLLFARLCLTCCRGLAALRIRRGLACRGLALLWLLRFSVCHCHLLRQNSLCDFLIVTEYLVKLEKISADGIR